MMLNNDRSFYWKWRYIGLVLEMIDDRGFGHGRKLSLQTGISCVLRDTGALMSNRTFADKSPALLRGNFSVFIVLEETVFA